jgi:hypothetical protein
MNGDPKTMTLTCPSGTTFYSSAHDSGCFPTGSKPENPNPDPGWDNAVGTCSDAGDIVVQCNAGCSYCQKPGAVPPGCHLCDAANPC